MLAICAPSCSPCCPNSNNPFAPPTLSPPQSFPISTSPNNWAHNAHLLRFSACSASSHKQQPQQQEKSTSAAAKKRSSTNRKKRPPPPQKRPVSSNDDDDDESDEDEGSRSIPPSPLPKPPAGFVLDPHGRVLMASSKRIAAIVDAANNLPLECVIRRVFESSRGQECMLLCPVDMPVQILKSSNFNGWSAVNDEEIEAIIPSAAYALAKIHMHLVISGFCYTARGGFCYTEEDILEFRTDDGEEIDGLPTEGVEITCFSLKN